MLTMGKKLKPINRQQLVKKLRKLWRSWPYSGWNHEYMIKDWKRLIIPNVHWWKDIPVWVLKAIIRQMWIDREDFIDS